MSMAAGLSLMLKLGSKLNSISVKGIPLDNIKSALKTAAMSSNIFALKIDSGEKQGWLIKEAVPNNNPIIVDPNGTTINDTPKSFNSESEAKAYQTANNLYTYTYNETRSSTISVTALMKTNPAAKTNVNIMADKLGPNCKIENERTWGFDSGARAPTATEFQTVIKNTILAAGK